MKIVFIGATLILVVCATFVALTLPSKKMVYSGEASSSADLAITASSTPPTASSTLSVTPPPFVVTHISTPDPVKAVYFTGWAAGTPSFQKKMWSILDGSTEVNSIVIDVKDYSGRISYIVDDPRFDSTLIDSMGSAQARISDIEQFIASLHAKDIYVIGRIQSFEDPYSVLKHPEWAVKNADGTLWKDAGGAYWMDPDSHGAWSYISAIAKQAYSVGFDEINFDYVRFPSDGSVGSAVYDKPASTTKAEAIKSFFIYLHDTLSPLGIPISADLFGQTTSDTGDMGIGQVIEDAFPYFDFIDPMVYPSHYINGFIGYAKPAEHPYQIVKYSMDTAVARAEATTTIFRSLGDELIASTSPKLYTRTPVSPLKIRPWLQAFDLGAVYTPAMVEAQEQATYDAGLNSWLLWNAGAVYNEAELVPVVASASSGMASTSSNATSTIGR
jgi:hypothetical protein